MDQPQSITSLNPESTDAPPSTFGGVLPSVSQAPGPGTNDLVSLKDEPQPQDLISLYDGTDKPGLSGEAADQRAAKAQFGLGDKSPGIDVLTNAVKNRTEDDLRKSHAVQQDLQDRQTQLKVIQDKAAQGSEITPDDVAQMSGISSYQPKNDPNTIWEKLYANQFVNSVVSLKDPSTNPVAQAFAKNPEAVSAHADMAANFVTHQEVAKTLLEDMQARAKSQGVVGWLADEAKGFVPGYNWFETYKFAGGKGRTDSYLQGSNLADKVSYYYSLTPQEMYPRLKEDLENISKGNPQEAVRLANAVLNYSTDDKVLDSAFGLADVASVVPVGLVGKGLTAGARALRGAVDAGEALKGAEVAGQAAKAASESQEPVKEAFKAAVKANAPVKSDSGSILTAMGDVDKGAQLNTQKRLGEALFNKQDPLNEGQGMKQLPTLLNPEEVVKGTKSNLSAVLTDRLVSDLQTNRDKVLSAMNSLGKVSRTTDEATQVAIQEAKERLKDRFNYIGDAVLDFKHTLPEETAANVGSVTARLGKTDGTTFDSLRDADQAARNAYKLPAGSYQVNQEGLGWTVDVTKHLDETSPGVRDAMITTENTTPQSLANQFLGRLRSANDTVSAFQTQNRLATVHGVSGLTNAMQSMAKDVGSLSRKERQALRAIMEKNKYDIDQGTGLRGRFYQSQGELEKDYLAKHGRLPTYKESKAYWTFVQINDIDWTLRNLGVFRDRARKGIESFRLFDESPDEKTGHTLQFQSKEFNGKTIDPKEFPWDNPETAGVVVHTKGSEPEHFYMSPKFATSEQRQKINSLIDNGYKLIQTENPIRPVFADRLGNDTVNFVLTKDFESKKLGWKQIPYRPGFHTEYPQRWFVKQPIIRKGGTDAIPRHIYEGDNSVMAFNTETEAKEFAQKLDYARRILKGDAQEDLGSYLSKNLPFNESDFRGYFTGNAEQALSLDHPFLPSHTGKNLGDSHDALLRAQYPNFENSVRSSYNLFQDVDKKFMGQRDNPLWTVESRGSELNPIYDLKSAREVDPFVSVLRGMSNVLRNRYFADYKIQAVESWAREFGDLLKADAHDLQNNPVWHIHNPNWVTTPDKERLAAAKNSRRAMIELLGTPSWLRENLDHIREKLTDSVYQGLGQNASDKAFDFFIGDGTKAGGGPMKLMRQIAFHEKIGLFNPVHFFNNAATAANALAIAPKHGLQGMMSGILQQFLVHGGDDPGMLLRLSKIAGTLGMKPEWFKESWSELKKTGLMVVDGEHAWKDDMADPKFFKTGLGHVLDKSAVFFREGERISRLTAWNTAYREWRSANPDALLTNAVRNKLLARADLFNNNMTRASNASWQQGVWSIPTQFWGYNARLMEQILGKRLTAAEKTRLVGVQAALYGIPLGGIGSVVGGVWNPYQDVREYLLGHGYDVNDHTIDALHSGIVGAVGRWITGSPTTLNEQIGAGGTSSIRAALYGDKDFFQILTGAAGSATGTLADTLDPVFRRLSGPFRGDDEQFPLTKDDLVSVLRNITSVDNAIKAYYMIQAHTLINKYGLVLDDKSTASEALLQLLANSEPRRVSDAQLMKQMDKTRADALKHVSGEVAQNQRLAIQAMINHDDASAKVYQTRINTLIKLGGFRPDEIAKLWAQVNKDVMPLVNQVPYDFTFKNAPADQVQSRQQRYFQDHQ